MRGGSFFNLASTRLMFNALDSLSEFVRFPKALRRLVLPIFSDGGHVFSQCDVRGDVIYDTVARSGGALACPS